MFRARRSSLFGESRKFFSRLQWRGILQVSALCVLLSALGACEKATPTAAPPPVPVAGPQIDFKTPLRASVLPSEQPIPIYAIVQDPLGVARVELMVDGRVIDSKKIEGAPKRFDYSAQWDPEAIGKHTLIVWGANPQGGKSASLAHVVYVGGVDFPPITGQIVTATPNVFVVTPKPTERIPNTPQVQFVTATPGPPNIQSDQPTPTPYLIVIPYGE